VVRTDGQRQEETTCWPSRTLADLAAAALRRRPGPGRGASRAARGGHAGHATSPGAPRVPDRPATRRPATRDVDRRGQDAGWTRYATSRVLRRSGRLMEEAAAAEAVVVAAAPRPAPRQARGSFLV
jgi:hypothetical protein